MNVCHHEAVHDELHQHHVNGDSFEGVGGENCGRAMKLSVIEDVQLLG